MLYNASLTFTQPVINWGKIDTSISLATVISQTRRYELLDTSSELESRLAALYHI